MNEKIPQSDVIFKNLFSAKRNEDLLVDFLESILQIKIDKIEAQKEVEPEIHNIEEKQGRLDIKATVNDELIVDVEMQNIDYKDTEKRAVFYAGCLIRDCIKPKEDYQNIKDIAVIWILDYELENGNEEYFTETMTVDRKYCKYEIIRGVKYYFIELPKFRRMVTNKLETNFENWLAFIDYKRKDLMEMAMNKNEKIRRANEEYEYLTGDEAVKRREELRNKAFRDEAAARRCGREEGEEARDCNRKSFGRTKRRANTEKLSGEIKGRMETAKNMLRDKMDKKTIIKYTGLTLKELEKITV